MEARVSVQQDRSKAPKRPALRLADPPKPRQPHRRRTDRGRSEVPADRLAAAKARKGPSGPSLRGQVVQGYLLGRPAEPWVEVSETVARALSLGSLRDWGAENATADMISGPVNRRLGRYR
jgi:hypothetical protein